jgi:hypothetical protein
MVRSHIDGKPVRQKIFICRNVYWSCQLIASLGELDPLKRTNHGAVGD